MTFKILNKIAAIEMSKRWLVKIKTQRVRLIFDEHKIIIAPDDPELDGYFEALDDSIKGRVKKQVSAENHLKQIFC